MRKKPNISSLARVRQEDMVTRYQNGETLQKIGDLYGISRERVRQILAKLGLKRGDGGISVTAEMNRMLADAKKEANCIDRWGCNRAMLAQYKEKYPNSIQQFTRQKQNAALRGIEWKFNYFQWIGIWVNSGHYEDRGRGQGYCMARIGDKGAYEIGNVRILTNTKNMQEAVALCKSKGKKWGGGARSKNHCLRGHLLSGENLYISPKVSRYCKACDKWRHRRVKKIEKSSSAKSERTI